MGGRVYVCGVEVIASIYVIFLQLATAPAVYDDVLYYNIHIYARAVFSAVFPIREEDCSPGPGRKTTMKRRAPARDRLSVL